LDVEQNFYFLEMNTRLQVEHPITEMITGMDLVRWQVEIAAGKELPFKQEDIARRGHSIEARLYAEDPDENFMPSPGLLEHIRAPQGPWVREDTGVYSGATVPVHYDPMISKLIVWAEDRDAAIGRMKRALEDYVVSGIKTNRSFLIECLEQDTFVGGEYDTEFVPRMMSERSTEKKTEDVELARLAAVVAANLRDEAVEASAGTSRSGPATGGTNPWKQAGRFRALRRTS
jgi:acetyl-CoA carboxylase biotin carboxylase subunit